MYVITYILVLILLEYLSLLDWSINIAFFMLNNPLALFAFILYQSDLIVIWCMHVPAITASCSTRF